MYEFLVKLGLRYGTVYAPSNNLEGIAVWFPSEKANFTTWQMIVSGVLTLYIKFSRATMDRWAKIVAFYLEMHEELVPFPHMYLYWMGVDVTKQKQGFGGILMQAMLDHIDKQGIPCFLETHKQNNIVYFKRFGFEVVNEHKVPGTNVPGWSLLRKV
ncbi:MAG: GNAT family N-acetyltransferase [Candidatus Lokiarchaeota archaeon]|nr:GNAT family N-acetyltransferase [Candidatus Lokiarchaeota archaeon]